jgi:hypothetical protein
MARHLFTIKAPLLGEFYASVERDFSFKTWVGDCEGRFVKLGWFYFVYDSASVLRRAAG